ncbi:MAG: 5'-deoxyadenosine deaminase [Sandaracinus sp.]|nr:5'-deoxyadenosine deaminase [Sandaracinus sp.]
MTEPDDLLLRGATVVTVDPARRVLVGDVRVRGGRIVAVGGRSRRPAKRIVDLRGHALIPGIVQAHVHLCQALFRGMADDLPLLPWLAQRIWPLEGAHDPRSLRASARLGLAEMIRAGTTTILDMGTVHHHDAVFDVLAQSGIRAFSGKAMMDVGDQVPKTLRETTASSLKESHRLRDRWNGAAEGRLRYAYAPRFILSCSEALMREVGEATRGGEALAHSHAAEHADERAAVKARLGMDDVAALESYGLAGPHTILAHGVQLRAAEMKRIAKLGTRFVHCPSANLKLASGIADVKAMRDAGMVVGLGADGAPCNNRMDPWTELRQAALLAKVRRDDAAALPAHQAFELATIEGARALGIDADVGSIEVGKKADLVALRLDDLHHEPGGDVYGRLVYSATPADVRHVFVDGRALLDDGELVTLDREKVLADARREGKKTLQRAGIVR